MRLEETTPLPRPTVVVASLSLVESCSAAALVTDGPTCMSSIRTEELHPSLSVAPLGI